MTIKKSLIFLIACTLSKHTIAENIFVTLDKADAVAVVNADTGAIDRLIQIGKRPRGIVLSQDEKQLFVAVSGENVIKKIDVATLNIVGSIPCDAEPKAFAQSGNFLYVSNDAENLLTVIDISQSKIVNRIPVAKEPEGVSISPDGQWVVSTSEFDDLVQWINTAEQKVSHESPVDARPRASQFTDDGKQLWVTSENAGKLTVFDTDTKQIVKIISFAIPQVSPETIKPVGIRIDKNRRFAYVALGRANRVAVIDAQKLEVIEYVPVGQRAWHLEFSSDQQRLYTANGLSGDISIINLEGLQSIQSVIAGQTPWGIAVSK